MKTNRAKLTKKLDELCSKKVRERDNKCIMCGGYIGDVKSLQAHHWIKSRGQSNKYRWDARNLVSVCYSCHIHKIHQHPTVPMMEELKERCIVNGIITESDYKEICDDNSIAKFTIKDLETKLEKLNEA